MNAYYHSLIEEIKKEIDEKSYAQAYELICQELNMPYVPEDALELLEYYKSECKPYLEQKSKSMDFSKLQDYVHGTLEQKIYAISILENTNLRMCHDEVQELLDSDLPDEYKGTLIEALMEQKIDDRVVTVAVYHVLHNALVNDSHAHRFKMMFHRKEIPYSTHEFQIWKI